MLFSTCGEDMKAAFQQGGTVIFGLCQVICKGRERMMLAILEQWGLNPDYITREWTISNEREIISIIRSLQNLDTTTLHIREGECWWSVDIDRGRFLVAFMPNKKSGYYLVSDPNCRDSILFAVGGQWVEVEERYLVDFEKVLHTAILFYQNGTLDVTNSSEWELQ